MAQLVHASTLEFGIDVGLHVIIFSDIFDVEFLKMKILLSDLQPITTMGFWAMLTF